MGIKDDSFVTENGFLFNCLKLHFALQLSIGNVMLVQVFGTSFLVLVNEELYMQQEYGVGDLVWIHCDI